jgi:hypothetical protein
MNINRGNSGKESNAFLAASGIPLNSVIVTQLDKLESIIEEKINSK